MLIFEFDFVLMGCWSTYGHIYRIAYHWDFVRFAGLFSSAFDFEICLIQVKQFWLSDNNKL